MCITIGMCETQNCHKWGFEWKNTQKTGPLPSMLHQNPSKNPNLQAGAQAPLAALRFGFLDGF